MNSLKVYAKVMLAEIKMNLIEAYSYKIGIITDVVAMIIIYLSCLFFDGYSSIGSYYNVGSDVSKNFVLQGYIFWSLAVLILGTLSNSIRRDAEKGTLEQKVMSVIPIQILLLGDFFASLIVNIIVIAIVCVFSMLFLGVTISFNFMTIIILGAMLVGMYGLSLILGGIALISKRIGNLVYMVQTLLLIISNAVVQVDSVNAIGSIFPLTLAIKIGRKFTAGMEIEISEIIFFAANCTLWLIFGMFIFELFLKKSKQMGVLSDY